MAARPPEQLLRGWLASLLCATAAGLAVGAPATATATAGGRAGGYRLQRSCPPPRHGRAACLAMRLIPSSLSPADLRASARRGGARGAKPAVTYSSPWPGYLTPKLLHEAYALPTETPASSTQTIAVVDAYNDPTAEADLGVYDSEFGLPPCTTANGCFRKVNEEGQAGPLPPTEGRWATEISIDVQMAHSICQSCHVLLVETDGETFAELGAGVNAAVKAGASEISNSYGGGEQAADRGVASTYYDHPATVITASSGDCGYLNAECPGYPRAANFPADSPDVVAVGGTSLTESNGVWTGTVWQDGGSGCSTVFEAPPWQLQAANFAATACGSGRSVADVAAIGDPNTGVDIYDSTPEGHGAPTGWGVWGGTSVSSPIVAAEYALAGGAHGVSYPAATLYAHLGQSNALYDVLAGANGSCGGATSCHAAVGFDGPSGVGSPIGLSAFSSTGSPTELAAPSIAGAAEQGQLLSEVQGQWTNAPTSYSYQWERCNGAGTACSTIAGATAQTYTPTPADVGSTLSVQETVANSAGYGGPATSAPTAVIVSDVPSITGFAPTSAPTGSDVKITGSALAATTLVTVEGLTASFSVISPSELEVTVPDGARPGKVSLTTPVATVTAKGKFAPSLSIESFSPAGGPQGTVVTLKGVGFNGTSSVSFDGVPASSVTDLSSKKLRATVPPGAGTGAITLTNTTAPLGTVSSAAGYAP